LFEQRDAVPVKAPSGINMKLQTLLVVVCLVVGNLGGCSGKPADVVAEQSGKDGGKAVAAPTPQPTPPAAPPAQSGEMMPLGSGADLDPALKRGCATRLPMSDEKGVGGQGELPRGGYKKLGCRDKAGLTVEWTMRTDEGHAGEVYMMTVTVPTQRLFQKSLKYLNQLSPPAARKEWPKAKSQVQSEGVAIIEAGGLKLIAMPGQAGPNSGQLVMLLTKPGSGT
jgi:hypothetical protein